MSTMLVPGTLKSAGCAVELREYVSQAVILLDGILLTMLEGMSKSWLSTVSAHVGSADRSNEFAPANARAAHDGYNAWFLAARDAKAGSSEDHV